MLITDRGFQDNIIIIIIFITPNILMMNIIFMIFQTSRWLQMASSLYFSFDFFTSLSNPPPMMLVIIISYPMTMYYIKSNDPDVLLCPVF